MGEGVILFLKNKLFKFSRKEFCMGKSTKTYEERIQEKDLRIEKLAQELKRYEAQKKP